jgi:excisionase family DNA binding protein
MTSLDDFGEVLTVAEAAAVLRVSRNTCYEAVNRDEVPTIRIGRRVLVPKSALRNLLARKGRPEGDGRAPGGCP